MPLSPAIAGWLRDAVHAAEISLNQSPDASILALAARERRVIITADLDFPRLLATPGTTATGLILCFEAGTIPRPKVRNVSAGYLWQSLRMS